MTAKEALHRKIEAMTDEEAQLALELLATDDEIELPPLTREDLLALTRALLQDLEGRVVPHEEVLRRFGRLT